MSNLAAQMSLCPQFIDEETKAKKKKAKHTAASRSLSCGDVGFALCLAVRVVYGEITQFL